MVIYWRSKGAYIICTHFWELIAKVKDRESITPVKAGIVMLYVEDSWALFVPNPDGDWMIKSSDDGKAYAIKRPR